MIAFFRGKKKTLLLFFLLFQIIIYYLNLFCLKIKSSNGMGYLPIHDILFLRFTRNGFIPKNNFLEVLTSPGFCFSEELIFNSKLSKKKREKHVWDKFSGYGKLNIIFGLPFLYPSSCLFFLKKKYCKPVSSIASCQNSSPLLPRLLGHITRTPPFSEVHPKHGGSAPEMTSYFKTKFVCCLFLNTFFASKQKLVFTL